MAQCFQGMFEGQTISLDRRECDVTSEKSIRAAFLKYDFNYVLNCAAMTDMESCQKNPKECFAINVTGAYLLNKVCLEKGKKLVHISSDYAVNPVNNYGWSKFLSEQVVNKKFLTIRTSFFSQKIFIISNLLKGKKTAVYKNLYFNPVSINRLAEEIKKNINKKGLINIFSAEKISFIKFADLFVKIFGIQNSLIKPVVFQEKNGLNRKKVSVIKSDILIDIEEDMKKFQRLRYN